MSAIESDNSPQSKSGNTDPGKRLLDTVAPMIKERFERQQRQNLLGGPIYQSITNQQVVARQPHQCPQQIRDDYHEYQQNSNANLVCKSSPAAVIYQPLKTTVTNNKFALGIKRGTTAIEQNNNNPLRSNETTLTATTSGIINSSNLRPIDSLTKRQRLSTIEEGSSGRSNGISKRADSECSNIADVQLIEKIKAKLLLSKDTIIPTSFLLKQRFKHFQLLNDQTDDVDENDDAAISRKVELDLGRLSRLDRKRSLCEMGFGQASTYVKSHVLGAGTYSIVYKGTSRLTEKSVALKEIQLERDEGIPFTAIREVSLLRRLKHNNIISLHDIISTRKALTLVFECIDRDLSRYMDQCDHKINLDNVRLFLYQLLRALSYCHSKKVLHRDLKPQNILISLNGDLKLADFGLARAISIPTKTFTDEVVTLWYRPPDVLLGNINYGTSIDLWGVGCIFFEMVSGFTLFTGIDSKKQIECIFEILGTPTEHDWPGIASDLEFNSINIPPHSGRDLSSMAPRLDDDGIELLRKLLKCNPNSRISSADAIRNKYFTQKLPPTIYHIDNSDSIFSIPEIQLAEEELPLSERLIKELDNISV